ncbi:MAG: ADP-ribosylation factor-like protein [Oscillospiraceae bacterium]|nr:ADP-ribosylation factor-like protein [Oscillospiraceae bacterium]
MALGVVKGADFEKQISNGIENLHYDKQIFFEWLCAVRALPFLGARGHFSFWKKHLKQRYIYSVLNALDTYLQADYGNDYADCFSFSSTNPGVAYIPHVADACTASYAYHAVNAVACASINAVAAPHSSYHAAYAARKCNVNLQDIILSDLSLIKENNYNQFNNDISIYGNIWNKFQNALQDNGCEYWGKLYEDIFKSGFVVDKEALERRLSVPKAIREQGAAAVAEYLENAERQGLTFSRRETRLIILGSAGAGKTTLVKRLNGDNSYTDPKDTTHGVDTDVVLDCNGIKTRVWDFGGQVFYHASHRCFMTENCVYILVISARCEDHRNISKTNYWLDTIRIYSENKAKVFIVINEFDNSEQNAEDYDTFKDGEYKSLIQEIYSFNVDTGFESITAFKNDLSVYIESVGHQVFGKDDNNAIKELSSVFKDNQILSRGDLERILIKHKITIKKEQERAIKLFNTLGIALSYDFMEDAVLNPYWISHGVYKVVDYMAEKKSKFIKYSELDVVFSDERGIYPIGKDRYILDLMKHYKIGFRNKDGIRGLIVPCAASQSKPKNITVDIEPDCLVTYVEREDLQEFPANFFNRYICANKNDIKGKDEMSAVWQTGMVLTDKEASALVELNPNNTRIQMTVWGVNKEEYKQSLEFIIDKLLKEYNFTSYTEVRIRGGKLVKFITVVLNAAVESAFKGITKGIIDK